MSEEERYAFNVGEDGLNYDVLDKSYNSSTQSFLLRNGLKPGLRVLDVGCGSGVMTAWIAGVVGEAGHVTAIDNSPEQLSLARRTLKHHGMNNTETQVCSAYDVASVGENYDIVYCRFLLHHLHKPRTALNTFFKVLKPGGVYIGEEGIISARFAYPTSFAWQAYLPNLDEDSEDQRDGDFGIKLFHACKNLGFNIRDLSLNQPLMWTREQKLGLLEGLQSYKETAISEGMSEQEWQQKNRETVRLIDDPKQLIGFYASCQVAARKENK